MTPNHRVVHTTIEKYGPLSAGQLRKRLGIPASTLKGQLRTLEEAGHVESIGDWPEVLWLLGPVRMPKEEPDERARRARQRKAARRAHRAPVAPAPVVSIAPEPAPDLADAIRAAGLQPDSVIRADGSERLRVELPSGWVWIDDLEDLQMLSVELAA